MNKYKTILNNIPPSPIVCYDFTNNNSYPTTGTVVTDIFKNSNASLINTPTYSAFTSGSIYFDGSNEFLITSTSLNSKFAGTSPNKSETTSIFMWVYMMDNGVILSEQGTSPIPNTGWFESVIERVSGDLKFGFWNGTSISSVTSSVATSLNTWYYVGLTYDGSQMKAYINGSLVGQLSFNRLAPYNGGTNAYYAIASECPTSMGDGGYAKMYLGRFEIFNYSLSQTQIEYNYIITKGLYGY